MFDDIFTVTTLSCALLVAAGCADDPKSYQVGSPTAVLGDNRGDGGLIGSSSIAPAPGDKAGDRALLLADPYRGRLVRVHDCDASCKESTVAQLGGTPVRTTVADLNGDGHQDIIVADVGKLWAEVTLAGRVLVLDGPQWTASRTLALGLARVACVEPGDLDGDGDLDVVVCEFGEKTGRLLWLEQRADGTWQQHALDHTAGAANAPVHDFDGDGDLDIVAGFSQRDEVVRLFRNSGKGKFAVETIRSAGYPCWGMSSLEAVDLDGDGDRDVVVTHGDMMDIECRKEIFANKHGVGWLQNDGHGHFIWRPIALAPGAYAVRGVDLDGDGDLDLVVSSFQDPYFSLGELGPNLQWLENDGSQRFSAHVVDDAPAAILSLHVTDMNNDGVPDILVGSMETQFELDDTRRLVRFNGLRK